MFLKLLILMLIPLLTTCMDKQSKEKTQDHELRLTHPNHESRLTHPKNLIDPKTNCPFKSISEAWDTFWDQAYKRDSILQQELIKKKLSEQKTKEETKS